MNKYFKVYGNDVAFFYEKDYITIDDLFSFQYDGLCWQYL